MEDDSMLKLFLDMSVPLRVMELKQRGGPAKDDFERVHSYLPLLEEEGNFYGCAARRKERQRRLLTQWPMLLRFFRFRQAE